MAAFAAHFHRPCPSRCGASQPARYRPTQPSGHCIDETRHHERSRIHQRRDAGDSPPRWDEPGKDGREIRLWHAVLAKRTCRVCDLQPGSDKRMLVAQARERFSLARVASVMHHHSAPRLCSEATRKAIIPSVLSIQAEFALEPGPRPRSKPALCAAHTGDGRAPSPNALLPKGSSGRV